MKKILILIISIGLIFGLVGIGTQAYFSDVETSSVNIFTAGVWEYTINATADADGSIEPLGEVIVPEGEDKDKTFTITPDEGYVIDDVLVDGISVGAVSSYQFINVTENHTIHAIFAPITWDNSSLRFTWAGTIDATQVCATVKNGDGSGVMQGEVEWELHYVESGQAPGPQNDEEVNIIVIAEGEIPALEQGDSYNICWLESGQAGPGIYKFKAYQRPGHPGTDSFWSDEIIIGSVINSAKEEKISNSTASFTITAIAGDGGSITPAEDSIITEGENILFTLNPKDGYRIEDVLVDGKSVIGDLVINDGIGIYSFINVVDNHTISAIFKIENENSSDNIINTDHSIPNTSIDGENNG